MGAGAQAKRPWGGEQQADAAKVVRPSTRGRVHLCRARKCFSSDLVCRSFTIVTLLDTFPDDEVLSHDGAPVGW